MSQTTQHRFLLWGWILFIGSAIFFMIASVRAGDLLSLAGGTLFLVACFVFLAPLLAQRAGDVGEGETSTASPPSKYSRYRQDWFRAVNSRLRASAAPMMPQAPAHQQAQNQRHSIRSELRFFASIR